MEKSWSPQMWDRVSYALFISGASIFLLPVLIATCTPLMWITSQSLPWGVYQRTHDSIRRGVLVHLCLPEETAQYAFEREYIGPGPCPGLYQEVLKSVAALEGDRVEISANGVVVNGVRIPQTPVYFTDSHGRPHTLRMPDGIHIVPSGYVFLLSNHHPRSWDSRYLGFVPLSAIRGTVQQVWTW